ncbi:MAG: type II toxin-antitoxin system HicB family antitoxin [Nanoarchaeota archaeon]
MENLIKYETITTRIMEARTFTVLIEQDEDGLFVAKVPDIPGCYTQGKTVQEALERIKEAIQVCLESEGQELTPLKFVGLQQVEVAAYA